MMMVAYCGILKASRRENVLDDVVMVAKVELRKSKERISEI
jgi:hypothetical protein